MNTIVFHVKIPSVPNHFSSLLRTTKAIRGKYLQPPPSPAISMPDNYGNTQFPYVFRQLKRFTSKDPGTAHSLRTLSGHAAYPASYGLLSKPSQVQVFFTSIIHPLWFLFPTTRKFPL
jgi:hypothetical protein